MGMSYRHSAGFGKPMEYSIIGKMLMEGLDCYVPLVDGNKTERNGEKKEYCKPQFEKYICNDFSRFY